MRKLVTLVAALLSVAAIVPVAASAAHLTPNPDFPHDDPSAADWQMGAILNLPFDACNETCLSFSGSEAWYMMHQTPTGWEFENHGSSCGYEYAGTTDILGHVEMNKAQPTSLWGGPGGCSTAVEIPWQGEMCVHEPSGEAWIRFDMSLKSSGSAEYLSGETFMQLDLDSGVLSNTGTFNHQYSTSFQSVLSTQWDMGFPEGTDLELLGEGSCGWPEMQS